MWVVNYHELLFLEHFSALIPAGWTPDSSTQPSGLFAHWSLLSMPASSHGILLSSLQLGWTNLRTPHSYILGPLWASLCTGIVLSFSHICLLVMTVVVVVVRHCLRAHMDSLT